MVLNDFKNAQARLVEVYGEAAAEKQAARYEKTIAAFEAAFGAREDAIIVSAPGRTEIGGNHTDHNNGHVLAAAINLDCIAVTAPSPDGKTRVISEGHGAVVIDLSDLSVREDEKSTTAALIRGVAKGLTNFGYKTGGFVAYVTSDVLAGSGLSSSAAFESLVGAIQSHLYNDGKVDAVEIAISGKLAENEYYGKASGLMDQTASANGGFVAIDFKDTANPVIDAVQFDISAAGYDLVVVAVGDDHENLSDQYSAIPAEMKEVAKILGCSLLRELDKETVLKNVGVIRKAVNDRAVLRAIHFFDDDARAVREAELLRAGDFEGFMAEINASGLSSVRYLQNITDINNPYQQGIALALCLAQTVLEGKGAWRVHGGGFGGTTLNFVPHDTLEEFISVMENAFGEGCCHVLSVRRDGAIRVM